MMKSTAAVRKLPSANSKRPKGSRRDRPQARLPAHLSKLPIWGTEAAQTQPLIQSGVLAFRRRESGQVAVLLVKKPRSTSWGIPKGNVEPELSFAENAAKEAFEEAGVKGRMSRHAAGSYRAIKRKYGLKLVIEVQVYLLEVSKVTKKWPEMGKREVKWCSPDEAARLLREPLLTDLCNGLMRL